MSEVFCKLCGKHFNNNSNQKTCNDCKNKLYKKVCNYCNKTFLAPYTKINNKNCSKECRLKFQKEILNSYKEVVCIRCGKLCKIKFSSYKKLCSECREIEKQELIIKPTERVCKICGRTFLSKGGRVRCDFCIERYKCKICNYTFRHFRKIKKHLLNVHNLKMTNNYIDIERERRQKNRKPKISKKVKRKRKRYNDGICAYCRKNKPSTFHHIVPRKYGGPTVPENCIGLCRKCHDEVEIKTDELLVKGKLYTTRTLRHFIIHRSFPEFI